MDMTGPFEIAEWVFLIAGTVGCAFAFVGMWAASEDFQYSHHPRIKLVAKKNLVSQIVKFLALLIFALIGGVGVAQTATPSQIEPQPQTWLFYCGSMVSVCALAFDAAYSYYLYTKLVGAAGGY